MLFYFVRHGDPVYDPDSLTPLGKKQAEAVCKRLSRVDFDRIFVSSSNRAIQTASPLIRMQNKEMEILDWCNEGYAYKEFLGDVPGEDRKKWIYYNPYYLELFNHDEVRTLGMQWYKHPYFSSTNAESGMKRIGKCADEFFESLGYKHNHQKHGYDAINPNDKKIVLFAHEGFGTAFISYILDIPYPMFTHFSMAHSSMTVIEFKEHNSLVFPVARQVSNDSHLYKEGLPTIHDNKIFI